MTGRQVLLYMPGSRWENVHGTDHKLAAALAEQVSVLWVDPPLPVRLARGTEEGLLPRTSELSEVAPGVTRLRSLSVPGFTRPLLAVAAKGILDQAIRRALRTLGMGPSAIVLSAPTGGFPFKLGGTRMLFVTDDWVAGSSMMGMSRPLIETSLARNVRSADVVAAVSPQLAGTLAKLSVPRRTIAVLPNGCEPPVPDTGPVRRKGTACLVGQLNERLDMDLLEAVQESGTPMVVIGPRTDRDHRTARRLDRFLSAENVTWLGEVPAKELAGHLRENGVGLTPYADSSFNRASFPLKTLDYLAAGMPVVATDLPAVRWLDTDLVAVGKSPREFAGRVQQALAFPGGPDAEERRRTFASRHTWQARAAQLLELIGEQGL